MKDLTKENGPIGPVVKRADYVFTNLARVTRDKGTFNRLEWHVMNLLHENKQSTEAEIIPHLDFLEDEEMIRNVIERFLKEALVRMDRGKLSLTPLGLEVSREVAEIQDEIKEKAFQGISESEYAITMLTLEKIIENLGEFLPSEESSIR